MVVDEHEHVLGVGVEGELEGADDVAVDDAADVGLVVVVAGVWQSEMALAVTQASQCTWAARRRHGWGVGGGGGQLLDAVEADVEATVHDGGGEVGGECGDVRQWHAQEWTPVWSLEEKALPGASMPRTCSPRACLTLWVSEL